jgi:hypothetical protein
MLQHYSSPTRRNVSLWYVHYYLLFLPLTTNYLDSFFVYAAALKQMIEQNNIPENRTDLFNRTQLVDILFSFYANNITVEGASGNISFDAQGNVNLYVRVLE